MKNQTNITDFNFKFTGYGHYKVTYTSPKTDKQWSITCDDMTLIDRMKNADEPKKVDLNTLKKFCKNN